MCRNIGIARILNLILLRLEFYRNLDCQLAGRENRTDAATEPELYVTIKHNISNLGAKMDSKMDSKVDSEMDTKMDSG